MKKIYCLVIGLLLIVLDFPIYTALEFPIAHIEDEPVLRSFSIEVIEQLMGSHFYIDILPDVIGYILIAVAAWGLVSFHKRFKYVMYSAIAAFVCSVLILVLPYVPVEMHYILGGVAVCKLADYFCIILIIFSVAKAVYAQVDGYMYLEMWNDFKMDWNIMMVAPIFIYILGLVDIVKFPVASALAIILYGLWLYAGVHFIYYVYDYCKKLSLFSER